MRDRLDWGVISLLVGLGMAPCVMGQGLAASVDFEGGQGRVVQIDARRQVVHLIPAGDPARGWPCWWYVRLDGLRPAADLTLVVEASGLREAGGKPLSANWALPDRAAYREEGGPWRQTAPGDRADNRMSYHQPVNTSTVWLAWGPPFVLHDAEQFVAQAAQRAATATRFVLATSREGREIPGIAVTPPAPRATRCPIVWVQARQHAWESGSSWVACGLLEWLTGDDSAAVQLRDSARVYVVPVMDVDNVVRGEGGKNQRPHDHNRDWTTEGPLFPAVRAAQQMLREASSAGQSLLFIDLHNPGPGDRRAYFYVPPDELLSTEKKTRLLRFLDLANQRFTGPLAFEPRYRVSGAQYDARRWLAISKNWVAAHAGGDPVAVTLETAWNTPASDITGYRTIGRQLGEAIADFVSLD